MYIRRHVQEWWTEPDLPKNKVPVSRRLKAVDPLSPDAQLPKGLTGQVGGFASSKKWVRYNALNPVDAGYIVPLYTLNDIGKRFGLSQNGKTYYRKHILPEPFDIVRRRSVHAHHWSRFTLMILDVVLKDLEGRGYKQFLKRFTDHIQLLHDGVAYLEDHYTDRHNDLTYQPSDKFGVTWQDR